MHKNTRFHGNKKRVIERTSIVVVLLLIIATGFFLLGGQEMDAAAKAQLDKADLNYREGRFAEAQEAYLKVQEIAPTNVTVLEQLGLIALWQNKHEEAERYFEDALSHLPWYKRIWPFNTQLKYRLAMTYYRADEFTKAAALFHESAGPIAVGPFRELGAFEQQMAFFADEAPYIIQGPEKSQIDFIVTDPLPVVTVSVNGSRPLHFFIDTGGAELILDDGLAEEIGAEIAGSFSTTYGGNTKAETRLGKVDSIGIGEFVVQNVPVYILDTDHMSSIFNGLEIKGIIGTRFLMHFLATIDYKNGCLVLQKATPESILNLDEQIAAGRAHEIPFWLIETHYIVAWGSVNNLKPELFFVDTGLAGKGFTAPESVLQEAGVSFDWDMANEGPVGGGSVKAVDIVLERVTLGAGGEIIEYNVPGVVIEKSVPVLGDALGFRIGGLISHQFFRNYSLTFDFSGMRMIVHE